MLVFQKKNVGISGLRPFFLFLKKVLILFGHPFAGLVGVLYDFILFVRKVFNLPSFTPPVRATVGEVRYSIEIDVGGERVNFTKPDFEENFGQPGSYFSKFKWSKNCPIFEIDPTTARAEPKNANKDPF